MRRAVFLLAVFWLLTPFATAQEPAAQPFNFAANQSVYIIAVKTPAPKDPSIWMQLHRNNTRPPSHIPTQAGSQNNPSGRATLERSATERATLERETPLRRILPPTEPQLKKLVEEEFLKQKKFRLADSPETADFIFFAHGEYTFSLIQRNGRGGGVVILGTGQGDTHMELNTLARLNLAAIPAAEYRKWQSDIASLFEKAKWREVTLGEFRTDPQPNYQEPPTKKLVQQFHKQALKK